MPLNSTQIYLMKEFSKDRLLPAITEILDHCNSEDTRQVCVYLILKAVSGKMDDKEYIDLLNEYLGHNGQTLLKNRLINVNKLFQSQNDSHIFVKSILDPRFNSDSNQKDWVDSCKQAITQHYSTKIYNKLQKLSPEEYNNSLQLIEKENKETNLEQKPSP